MKYLIVFIFLTFSFFGNSQEVVEEKIVIDSTEITYRVIYRETVGDYFQLKKAVFSNDTSITAIEKNFSNGHQNGLTRIYYPSGKLRVKAVYGNDKLQGEWTHYGEDGIIITKGIYKNGVKDGFWTYKSKKTYGRYKKGLKNRKWIKKGINNESAHYVDGKLKRGSRIFENEGIPIQTNSTESNKPDNINLEYSTQIDTPINIEPYYVSLIDYLSQNYYLRKAAKDYFRTTKKEKTLFVKQYINLEKNIFKFNVAPFISAISMNEFIKEEKLTKQTIDSLLKVKGVVLQEELNTFKETESLGSSRYSTDKSSNIVVYLSKKIDHLIVAELIEFPTKETNIGYSEALQRTDIKRMKILFLLNDADEIIDVEYQKKP